jgi:hypothetical protein
MFLVGPKVFSFVVKGVKVIFWGVQKFMVRGKKGEERGEREE